MLTEDLINRIRNYFSYCVKKGLNLQKNQIVEIVGSSYLDDYISILASECRYYTNNILINYTDGKILEDKISDGYHKYILSDIKKYKGLMKKGFARIVLTSPFTPAVSLNEYDILEYKNCIRDLQFVNDYFMNLKSQKTIIAVSNCYWAAKLQISEEKLWNEILNFIDIKSNLDSSKLSDLNLKKLKFETKAGTNLTIALTKNFRFQNKYQTTKNGILFCPNVPCLEVYTAPIKYGVNGVLVSSKPVYYKGHVINNYHIKFKNGKIVDTDLDKYILLDDTMYYCGEIAMVDYFNDFNFYAGLLNENTGCHLALGYAYSFGIKNKKLINKSDHHIDLVFGDDTTTVIGIDYSGNKIIIFKDGKYVYE